MGQADPILTRLGAGPAVKKLVETALALSGSPDPQQRNHAYSFMESAIRELEDAENRGADAGLGPDVDDGIDAPKLREEGGSGKHDAVSKVFEEEERDDDKDDDKHKRLYEKEDEDKKERKLHEEVLDNHNNGPREDGSEQSTENTAPYAGEGVDTTNGEKPMQDMDDTVNQWSETNGMIVPGLPPIDAQQQMGGAMNGQMNGNGGFGGAPGLDPNIAQELGQGMPPPPQLNDNQMMRQMQYTIKQAVYPLVRHIKAQNETFKAYKETLNDQRKAIKQLAIELRETKNNGGNMRLDLDSMKQNATASFRETTTQQLPGFTSPTEIQSVTGVQPLPNYQRNKVAVARSEIEQMDKMLNTQKNPMYT